jgi:hypothetical protein
MSARLGQENRRKTCFPDREGPDSILRKRPRMSLPAGDVAFFVIVILLARHLARPWPRPACPGQRSGSFFKTKRIKIFLDKFGQKTTTFACRAAIVFLLTILAAAALHFWPRIADLLLRLPAPSAMPCPDPRRGIFYGLPACGQA